MKLLTFRSSDGPRLGALRHGDEVVELADPPDMLSLIDSGEEGLELVRSALSRGRGKVHALADHKAQNVFEVMVGSADELNRVMRNLGRVRGVMKVARVRT